MANWCKFNNCWPLVAKLLEQGWLYLGEMSDHRGACQVVQFLSSHAAFLPSRNLSSLAFKWFHPRCSISAVQALRNALWGLREVMQRLNSSNESNEPSSRSRHILGKLKSPQAPPEKSISSLEMLSLAESCFESWVGFSKLEPLAR